MEDKEARKLISELALRVLAMRDVVARLVAYEAQRRDDPDELLRDFAEATETHIADVSRRRGKPSVIGEEGIRKEVDWIVAAARKMLPDDKEP
jgi:hypothetical protein